MHVRLRARLGLSPREYQIVLGALDGLGHLELSEALGCSVHTIDSHLRRIYRKLDVNSAAGLVSSLFVAFIAERPSIEAERTRSN